MASIWNRMQANRIGFVGSNFLNQLETQKSRSLSSIARQIINWHLIYSFCCLEVMSGIRKISKDNINQWRMRDNRWWGFQKTEKSDTRNLADKYDKFISTRLSTFSLDPFSATQSHDTIKGAAIYDVLGLLQECLAAFLLVCVRVSRNSWK